MSCFICHPGMNCTLTLLKQHLRWSTLKAETVTCVSACTVCALSVRKSLSSTTCWSAEPSSCTLSPLAFVPGLPPSQGNAVFLIIVEEFSQPVHVTYLTKLPIVCEMADICSPYFSSSQHSAEYILGNGSGLCYCH